MGVVLLASEVSSLMPVHEPMLLEALPFGILIFGFSS